MFPFRRAPSRARAATASTSRRPSRVRAKPRHSSRECSAPNDPSGPRGREASARRRGRSQRLSDGPPPIVSSSGVVSARETRTHGFECTTAIATRAERECVRTVCVVDEMRSPKPDDGGRSQRAAYESSWMRSQGWNGGTAGLYMSDHGVGLLRLASRRALRVVGSPASPAAILYRNTFYWPLCHLPLCQKTLSPTRALHGTEFEIFFRWTRVRHNTGQHVTICSRD